MANFIKFFDKSRLNIARPGQWTSRVVKSLSCGGVDLNQSSCGQCVFLKACWSYPDIFSNKEDIYITEGGHFSASLKGVNTVDRHRRPTSDGKPIALAIGLR